MKVIFTLGILAALALLPRMGFATPSINQASENENMRNRIEHAKDATVRIFVNGQPSGTGFIVSPTGAVATCFHVVQNVVVAPTAANPNQVNINLAPNIEVELNGGQRVPATAHPACVGQAFGTAVARDYFLLNIGGQNRPYFRFGSFADAHEGDRVYSYGCQRSVKTSQVRSLQNQPV
jgi:trypsin-like peptidase